MPGRLASPAQQPATAGLPPPLQQQIATIEGTFEAYATMGGALSRFCDAVTTFEDVVVEDGQDLDMAIRALRNDVQDLRSSMAGQMTSMEQQVRSELNQTRQRYAETQHRMVQELGDVLSRSQVNLDSIQEQATATLKGLQSRADEDFDKVTQRLFDKFRVLEGKRDRKFGEMLQQMKERSGDVANNVRTAQSIMSRSQSQLVGLNTWAVAWPEAIRTVHLTSQRPAPPDYVAEGQMPSQAASAPGATQSG
ncbi:hypothetical protein OC844_001809 [Tilletia horrida]|nr:hypothetical protein OC844_001809 [Tilletia horrida]